MAEVQDRTEQDNPTGRGAAGALDACRDAPASEVAGAPTTGGQLWARIGLNPLIQLTLTRVREFVREPEVIFWVFAFPVLLAFALGIAFREAGPEKIRVAIPDVGAAKGGPSPSDIAGALAAVPGIDPVLLSPEEASRELRTGKVALVVSAAAPPSDENERAGGSGAPRFDYRYDPTRPDSRIARLTVDDALQRSQGRADAALVQDKAVTEPGARYIDFLIPGLVGLNLMGSGMWGLGFAVVQARTRKLLKRFAATPMRRSHFLLSFVLSRLVFLFLEVAAVVGFGWLVFDVAVHGSLVALAGISVLGAMAFGGLGLLVAARPKTIEGVSGMMNLIMVPMWLLSGTFFSASRFPDVLQPFIKALPLTALNDSLRAVMNEGLPISSSMPEIAVMTAWGVVTFAVALRFFRWQ